MTNVFSLAMYLAPTADPALFPSAALLAGIGFAVIYRLAPGQSAEQASWLAIGLCAFALTLAFVRDHRKLDGYTYTIGLVGVGLLLLPILPGLGREINGARVWIGLGPLTFQPAELGKVLIAIFLASYLNTKRELLQVAPGRLGPFQMPQVKHLGPVLLAWGVSLAVLFAPASDVPSAPVLVPGDAARLHQVLANLLGNVRTHTPDRTTATLRLRRGRRLSACSCALRADYENWWRRRESKRHRPDVETLCEARSSLTSVCGDSANGRPAVSPVSTLDTVSIRPFMATRWQRAFGGVRHDEPNDSPSRLTLSKRVFHGLNRSTLVSRGEPRGWLEAHAIKQSATSCVRGAEATASSFAPRLRSSH